MKNLFKSGRSKPQASQQHLPTHSELMESLKMQVEAVAASFEWDPSTEWVQTRKQNLGTYLGWISQWINRSDAHHRTMYEFYKMFDPNTYFSEATGDLVIYAQYSKTDGPSPLDVYRRSKRRSLRDEGINRIVVASHETSVYSGSTLRARFYNAGRKMDRGDLTRSLNAQKLLKELIGREIDISDIALRDLQGYYSELTFEWDFGNWKQVHEEGVGV